MKTLCKVLSLLLLASAGAFAQSAASGNISAQSTDCTVGQSCLALNNLTTGSASAGGVTVGLSGTWSGTVVFEATNDGTNWVAINATSASGTSPVTSAAANDTFQINSAGFTGIRVRCSAFSSGPIGVKLQSSTASARSNGSGGGGGGGTPPGGAIDSVQYNNSGVFGGAVGVSVDSGTTTILNATGGVTTGSSPPSNCVAGSLCASQVASHPTPTAGVNSLDSDSVQGCWMQTLGTASPACIVNTVTAPVTLSAAGVLAVPAATSSVLGIVRADNTTITNAAGVLTAVTSGGAFTGGSGTSFQDAQEISAPGAPASGYDRLYMDLATHTIKCKTNSSGNCLPTSGTVTTSGSPAATYCSIFSGSTAIVGTADCTFAAGALTLGAAGTSTGVLNMAGTTSGSISVTPNATASTLTLGGSLTTVIIPNGSGSAVSIGSAANTGIYNLNAGVAHATTGTLDFFGGPNSIKATGNVVFSSLTQAGNNTLTGGFDGATSGTTAGGVKVKGADFTSGSTTASTAGAAEVRGGNNAGTGAHETAGNTWTHPGDVTSATPTTADNGTGIFSLSGVKGSTYTTSALQAISATATTAGRPPTYSDATASGIFSGVALAADGNAANVQVMGDATVLSAASVTFTAGDIVCQDGSNPKDVIDNGTTTCPTTPQVGHVQFTNTGTTHYVTLMMGGTGGGGSASREWSLLTNPTGNLALSMGTDTSIFSGTDATDQFFAWKNTTAAVVGTSQGSPVLSNCGRAFHGSADVEDCMTLSELPGNGNDAGITFNIGHTGTSDGLVTTAFVGPVQSGGGTGAASGTSNIVITPVTVANLANLTTANNFIMSTNATTVEVSDASYCGDSTVGSGTVVELLRCTNVTAGACVSWSPISCSSTLTQHKCFTDPAPAAGDDLLEVIMDPPAQSNITRFSCGVTGTTSVVANLVKGGASLIADTTCTAGDANKVVVTTFANGSAQCGGTTSCIVAAHAPVTVHLGTITGSPTSLTVCVDYQ